MYNFGGDVVYDIEERISNLESKIWCWAIIYYRLGSSVVTDRRYDETSRELQRLIKDYPYEFVRSRHYSVFKDFDWVSGYDLPLYDPYMTQRATMIMIISQGGMDAWKRFCVSKNNHRSRYR